MDTSAALARKEYLKKYVNNPEDEKKKKKSKKSKKPQAASIGVRVVDEDPVWQKPVMIKEEESEDEVQPQVEEDIEVKRMKRMEQIRARNAKSEDGSGWVVVADVRSQGDQLNPVSQDADSLNGDISPPRRNRPNSPKSEPLSEDISPPRRNRPNSQKNDDLGGDISPPRRNRPVSHETDDLGGDISPPRRNRPHSPTNDGSVEDISPPRRRRPSSQITDAPVEDLSPPRKKRKDLSPPRNSHDIDLSPPWKNKKTSKDVAKTGLITGKDIQMEIAKKKKEELTRYKELDPSVSGRGAQPVYRDKAGNRMTKEEVLKQQKGEEKPKEKELEWGTGLAQKREAEARQRELELEKEKPFARGRDDPELDNMLKERVRWGDPMAHLVKSKQPELVLQDYGEDEKMKESGFIVPQKIPIHSWIVRKVDAPSNRYGIKPGRHWDGVDRSNGYEKEYFKRINERNATEKEAYLWSVSDM